MLSNKNTPLIPSSSLFLYNYCCFWEDLLANPSYRMSYGTAVGIDDVAVHR